ncbi:MAG TPA: sigma-70 family RNA polymerase sigma factor [Pyrinomonadaceae bacterium]|jgi:RNA polymerase sigma-70 factor (ECF subfamily)|nr:sigma-70 family RNA polymerase sigma factor [Pyrinomonadaceae bacterium]
MDYPSDIDVGSFEAKYRAFLGTLTQLRPRLHRYCARMTGSVMDGEDVVQEALFEAYRKLDQFDDSRPLGPWLFRIAHNRCIDFLRRRNVRQQAEAEAIAETLESITPDDLPDAMLDQAVEHLVITLPPKERACVLLKDVFDYSLEEIADLVDSTVGGVKAALSRGRGKLKTKTAPTKSKTLNPEALQLLQLYVERFNRHDWDGLRELISADARLRVADAFSGRLSDSPYFGVYENWPWEPWRMAVGEIDGKPAVIILRRGVDAWEPYSAIRLGIVNQRVTTISDYWHAPWILESATFTILDG